MSPWLKFLIGLGAALAAGWVGHGPLGRGEAFVGGMDARAQAVVRKAAVPGVAVRFGRDPLSRTAFFTGPADQFQREGQGEFPGLNDRVRAIPGVAGVRWDAGRGTPLIAETLGLAAIAYLLGIGIGWFLFGRRRHEGFL